MLIQIGVKVIVGLTAIEKKELLEFAAYVGYERKFPDRRWTEAEESIALKFAIHVAIGRVLTIKKPPRIN